MRTLTRLGTATMMAAAAVSTAFALSSGTATADDCTMGITPLEPFTQTCGIPNDAPVVNGASPGQGAVVQCQGDPACLSYVVNGGPGFGNNPPRP